MFIYIYHYNVAAESKRDISYLTTLPGASDRLQIFHADLNQPDTFDEAIQGCTGVFHLAHPMDIDNKEPEETVTKRALEGTLGILKACLNSKTVKRVVYTSSLATILFNSKGLSETDENTWSEIDICKSSGLVGSSYLVSKTVVEKTALEFAEKHGLDIVTVILPIVVGPFICPNIPSSVYMGMAPISGTFLLNYMLLLMIYPATHMQLNGSFHFLTIFLLYIVQSMLFLEWLRFVRL